MYRCLGQTYAIHPSIAGGVTNVLLEWLDLPSEEISLDDSSVDAIVLPYTLCTIPDWLAA